MEFHPIEQKVREYFLGKTERSTGLRMSKAGDCPRMLDYENILGLKPVDYYQSLRMMKGTWFHSIWQKVMKEIFGDDFVDCETEITWLISADGETHPIPGHPDGVIVSMDAVYELKSVSRNTFELIRGQGHPIPSHVEQGNLYAHILRRTKLLVHYFCTDSGESLYYEVPYSSELASATEEKFRQRIINKKTKTLAPRPYVDPTGSPCFFCPYVKECYEGFSSEVSAMGSAKLTKEQEPNLYRSCDEAHKARSTRLEMEKLEDYCRTKSVEFMLAKGIKSVLIGEYEVSVTVGKRGNPSATIRRTNE